MSHGQHHEAAQHLNEKHADDLVAIARALGGHPDATSARAEHVDQAGIDLVIDRPGGPATVRVDFVEPLADAAPNLMRAAFEDLAARARAALTDSGE
jgi:hypothetical protein